MDKNIFYFLIGLAVVIVVSIIVLYNRLARLRNKIKQSKSGNLLPSSRISFLENNLFKKLE